VTATREFIDRLTALKAGDLALLRTHAGLRLDESVAGFDLFAGLWWPLRRKSAGAPRREVAWLITKLYACDPIPHLPVATLPRQLGRCVSGVAGGQLRFQRRIDEMLRQPLGTVESALRWALRVVSARALLAGSTEDKGLDWVRLTDDLSVWERESTRLRWAQTIAETHCNPATHSRSKPC
jgi:hypothetical protein